MNALKLENPVLRHGDGGREFEKNTFDSFICKI